MLKKSYVSTPYIDPVTVSSYAHNKTNAVIIDDIDHNGYIDLVTFPSEFTLANPISPIAWTNTNGVFSANPSVIKNPVPYQYFRDSVAGDFNNDGFTDYFQADQGWELNNRDTSTFKGGDPALLLGSSTGLEWQPLNSWVTNPASKTFNHIADAADYDRDGDLDIAVAAFWDFKIYKNQGGAKFTQREDTVPVNFNGPSAEFGGASGATFIELNGEYAIAAGRYRAWNATTGLGPVSILTQQNGQFVETYTVARPNLGSGRERNYGASDMFNMDMNSDGREDLVITWETEPWGVGVNDGLSNVSSNPKDQRYKDLSNTVVSIYFQDASGKLVANNTVYNLADSTAGAPLFFEDFNLDGHVDFWTSGFHVKPSNFNKQIFINDGQGNFSNPKDMFNISEAFPDWYTLSPYFFDANNDGAIDVVAMRQVFSKDTSHSIGQELHTFLSDRPAYNINGNNKFLAVLDDKTYDGKAGVDTAVFSGKSSDYTIAVDSPQRFTVTDKIVGRDGKDVFVNVERFKFNDGTLAVDIASNAGQAYRLYTAALDRAPDAQGLGYWIQALDNGAGLRNVAGGFVASTEFRNNFYGDGSNATFINALYTNILDRAPEGGGYDYWLGRLNSGAERADVLVGFSESAENNANVIGLIGGGLVYQEYIG